MEEYPYAHPMGRTKFVHHKDSHEMSLKFSPTLCLQRYSAVLNCLNDVAHKEDIRIVTEYGANTCRFLYQALQTTWWLEQINLVDVDAQIISTGYSSICEPRWNRTQRERPRRLKAVAYEGNVALSDPRVSDTDVVIGIELIEHLTAVDFKEFPQNVFGYIQPKYVIFTTPNRDFNVLFNRQKNWFRHPDHKFEFTRAEFSDWVHSIVTSYPSYNFKIYGIGAPPDDIKLDVGFASQMVIFKRITEPVPLLPVVESFRLIGEILLNCGDDRTDEEKSLAKLAKCSSLLIDDLTRESTHLVYMRQERCKERHSMDVMPVQMVVMFLEKKNVRTDVDTLIMAVREYNPIQYEVQMTIALGPVFVVQCECDSNYHDEYPAYDNSIEPSSFFYALPFCNIDLVEQNVESAKIRHHIEQFLETASRLGEFSLVTTRETCAVKHSMSFLTPQVVVAYLKTNRIETDVKMVLQIWNEANSKIYPLEETSFGYVILMENYCGQFPCKSDQEDYCLSSVKEYKI